MMQRILLFFIVFLWVATFFIGDRGKLRKDTDLEVGRFTETTVSKKDVEALALNIYHESRGLRGKDNEAWRAVTAVVFNRLQDKRFPKTIQGVIYQEGPEKGMCAFSWYCDSLSNAPQDARLYKEAMQAAHEYLEEYRNGIWRDPTSGAHSYHSTRVPPNAYFQRLRVTKIVWNETSGHYFYKDSSEPM